MADSWLKRDAKNRAWRVMLKGFIVIVLLPALDAMLQVLVNELRSDGAFGITRTLALTELWPPTR